METLVAVLLQVASAASSAPPLATASVVWASHPVRSNETLMLQGYGVNAATRVTLQGWSEGTKGWGRKLELEPESHSARLMAADGCGLRQRPKHAEDDEGEL